MNSQKGFVLSTYFARLGVNLAPRSRIGESDPSRATWQTVLFCVVLHSYGNYGSEAALNELNGRSGMPGNIDKLDLLRKIGIYTKEYALPHYN